MHLTEAPSREFLQMHGVYVAEACDRCGQILGQVRYTRRNEPGDWCSQVCRDGIHLKVGVCQGCGVSLNGKRKHAKFCSDTCRKRQRVRDRAGKPETPIADKGLADSISRFGYVDSRKGQDVNEQPRIEVNHECEITTR
jgi:hypothetical protein